MNLLSCDHSGYGPNKNKNNNVQDMGPNTTQKTKCSRWGSPTPQKTTLSNDVVGYGNHTNMSPGSCFFFTFLFYHRVRLLKPTEHNLRFSPTPTLHVHFPSIWGGVWKSYKIAPSGVCIQPVAFAGSLKARFDGSPNPNMNHFPSI